MTPTFNQLQLAFRMRVVARLKLRIQLDVPRLLRDRRYAREALALCLEAGDSLASLARRFEQASSLGDIDLHLGRAALAARAELAQLHLVPRAPKSVRLASAQRAPTVFWPETNGVERVTESLHAVNA